MSTAERLPKSTEPSVDDGLPMRTPSIRTRVSPGLEPRSRDLRHGADAARFVDIEAGDAAQDVGEALGPELLDLSGGNDRHRSAGLANRLLDPIGGHHDFGQFVGARPWGERAGQRDSDQARPALAGRNAALNMAPPAVPPTAPQGCAIKGRSPGSRVLAPLLLPRTLKSQWIKWRAARRLQLRGQPRPWPEPAEGSDRTAFPFDPARAGSPMTK